MKIGKKEHHKYPYPICNISKNSKGIVYNVGTTKPKEVDDDEEVDIRRRRMKRRKRRRA